MSARRASLVGLVLLGLAGIVFATVATAPHEPPVARDAKIVRDVEAALRRFDAPGAVVMVLRNGHVSFVRAFGWRDVARRLPARVDTLFEIGSITKQFTAASILQLQEAGKLNIDEPLATCLPDAPHAEEITLRQMLTMTSGLHDYLDGQPHEIEPLLSRPASYREVIARVAGLPLDFPPGSRWSYSNTNYFLLGRVIEIVSGESYRDYLWHHIIAPLRMTSTHTTAELDHLSGMAIGYRHAKGRREIAPRIDANWGWSAGFLVTSLADLAKWDAGLRGGKIVSPEDYRLMTTSFMTSTGSTNYGLGLFVDSVYGEPRIGHTGGTQAFTAADEYFPRQDTRIIALTNLGDPTPEAGEAVTSVVFADLYPAIAAKARTPAPGENASVTQTVREAFRELQVGKDYARFSTRLRGKLAGGIGATFAAGFGPYGAPTQEIFKGMRRDVKDSWYDYVIQFGPGVSMPFSVKIGADKAVTSFSVG